MEKINEYNIKFNSTSSNFSKGANIQDNLRRSFPVQNVPYNYNYGHNKIFINDNVYKNDLVENNFINQMQFNNQNNLSDMNYLQNFSNITNPNYFAQSLASQMHFNNLNFANLYQAGSHQLNATSFPINNNFYPINNNLNNLNFANVNNMIDNHNNQANYKNNSLRVSSPSNFDLGPKENNLRHNTDRSNKEKKVIKTKTNDIVAVDKLDDILLKENQKILNDKKNERNLCRSESNSSGRSIYPEKKFIENQEEDESIIKSRISEREKSYSKINSYLNKKNDVELSIQDEVEIENMKMKINEDKQIIARISTESDIYDEKESKQGESIKLEKNKVKPSTKSNKCVSIEDSFKELKNKNFDQNQNNKIDTKIEINTYRVENFKNNEEDIEYENEFSHKNDHNDYYEKSVKSNISSHFKKEEVNNNKENSISALIESGSLDDIEHVINTDFKNDNPRIEESKKSYENKNDISPKNLITHQSRLQTDIKQEKLEIINEESMDKSKSHKDMNNQLKKVEEERQVIQIKREDNNEKYEIEEDEKYSFDEYEKIRENEETLLSQKSLQSKKNILDIENSTTVKKTFLKKETFDSLKTDTRFDNTENKSLLKKNFVAEEQFVFDEEINYDSKKIYNKSMDKRGEFDQGNLIIKENSIIQSNKSHSRESSAKENPNVELSHRSVNKNSIIHPIETEMNRLHTKETCIDNEQIEKSVNISRISQNSTISRRMRAAKLVTVNMFENLKKETARLLDDDINHSDLNDLKQNMYKKSYEDINRDRYYHNDIPKSFEVYNQLNERENIIEENQLSKPENDKTTNQIHYQVNNEGEEKFEASEKSISDIEEDENDRVNKRTSPGEVKEIEYDSNRFNSNKINQITEKENYSNTESNKYEVQYSEDEIEENFNKNKKGSIKIDLNKSQQYLHENLNKEKDKEKYKSQDIFYEEDFKKNFEKDKIDPNNHIDENEKSNYNTIKSLKNQNIIEAKDASLLDNKEENAEVNFEKTKGENTNPNNEPSIMGDENFQETIKDININYVNLDLKYFENKYHNYLEKLNKEQKVTFKPRASITDYLNSIKPRIIQITKNSIDDEEKLVGLCCVSYDGFSKESLKLNINHVSFLSYHLFSEYFCLVLNFLKENFEVDEILLDLFYELKDSSFELNIFIRDLLKDKFNFKWSKLENVREERILKMSLTIIREHQDTFKRKKILQLINSPLEIKFYNVLSINEAETNHLTSYPTTNSMDNNDIFNLNYFSVISSLSLISNHSYKVTGNMVKKFDIERIKVIFIFILIIF